jgi:hypothetical protein
LSPLVPPDVSIATINDYHIHTVGVWTLRTPSLPRPHLNTATHAARQVSGRLGKCRADLPVAHRPLPLGPQRRGAALQWRRMYAVASSRPGRVIQAVLVQGCVDARRPVRTSEGSARGPVPIIAGAKVGTVARSGAGGLHAALCLSRERFPTLCHQLLLWSHRLARQPGCVERLDWHRIRRPVCRKVCIGVGSAAVRDATRSRKRRGEGRQGGLTACDCGVPQAGCRERLLRPHCAAVSPGELCWCIGRSSRGKYRVVAARGSICGSASLDLVVRGSVGSVARLLPRKESVAGASPRGQALIVVARHSGASCVKCCRVQTCIPVVFAQLPNCEPDATESIIPHLRYVGDALALCVCGRPVALHNEQRHCDDQSPHGSASRRVQRRGARSQPNPPPIVNTQALIVDSSRHAIFGTGSFF